MKYEFSPSSIGENQVLFDEYISSLSDINDDFWEGHILNCQVFRICQSGETIGLCGIHSQNNLVFFYTPAIYLRYAQPAFAAMLATLAPQFAYVPTSDELFLSLSMDRHVKIDMQAYFFKYGAAIVRPPDYPRGLLKIASSSNEADILDDEGVAENIALGKYYIMRSAGIFLGQGFFNKRTIIPGAASIGMSVHMNFRRMGVGRSIIMHLADICKEQGLTPCCGCWYYNHNSKATLESAGFVTKTRLLKVWLK